MFYIKNDNQVENFVNTDSSEAEVRPTVLNQTKAHPSRSSKYSFISTGDILEKFAAAGFQSKLIKQEKCRGHYAGFGTHLIALSHEEIQVKGFKGEVQPQLLLRNSYHGRTKIMINLGLYRMVCSNGLMLGSNFQGISLKHIGITSSDVDGILGSMKETYQTKVVPLIDSLKSIQMTESEKMVFAQYALDQRLSHVTKKILDTEAGMLLQCRRSEDMGDSAWNVLQRVQENLGLNFRPSDVSVTYKIETTDKDNNVVERQRKVTRVSNIQKVTDLNQSLFNKMEEMYAISI